MSQLTPFLPSSLLTEDSLTVCNTSGINNMYGISTVVWIQSQNPLSNRSIKCGPFLREFTISSVKRLEKNTRYLIVAIKDWLLSYSSLLRNNAWDVNFFNWSIFNLQCCDSFKHTAKWFSYIYIYTHIYVCIYIYILFQILFHYRLSQDTEYSSLCYTVGLCCLPILYIVVCTC